MRNTLIRALCEEASTNSDLYLITGDLGFGVLDKFWEAYPKQFINAGISEQNMTGVAAGLALEGKCCFTYSIGNFPTLRCLEQIRNEIAYNNLNVNIIAVGGGFSYGGLGMSHHATEDLAIMRAVPGMTVFTPCDPSEAEAVAHLAVHTNAPTYIRLARGTDITVPHLTTDYQIGKANQLFKGEDIAILSTGTIACEAFQAAQILESNGISAEVWSFLTIKPIDEERIRELIQNYEHIITVEEANIVGGFGSAVAEILSTTGYTTKLHRLGLNDQFTDIVGSQQYLRDRYGISSEKIANVIYDILGHEK